MAVLKYSEAEVETVAPGIVRRKVYTDHLMTLIIDFSDGPKSEPDPLHSHPHEQTSYIAFGEVLFLMEGEEPQHLKTGDLFYVPPGIPHGIQLLSTTARLVDSFTPLREDFLK